MKIEWQLADIGIQSADPAFRSWAERAAKLAGINAAKIKYRDQAHPTKGYNQAIAEVTE